MNIEIMKQALEALEEVQRYDKTSEWFEKKVSALRQAIAEAEDAVAAEREACARLAEDGLIGHTIAKAIRARGEA